MVSVASSTGMPAILICNWVSFIRSSNARVYWWPATPFPNKFSVAMGRVGRLGSDGKVVVMAGRVGSWCWFSVADEADSVSS